MEHQKNLDSGIEKIFYETINISNKASYHGLTTLIDALSDKLKNDARKDTKNGRIILAGHLEKASTYLSEATENIFCSRQDIPSKDYLDKEQNKFVAKELGNLSYDGLANYLVDVSLNLADAFRKDTKNPAIYDSSLKIDNAHCEIQAAWEVCKKYMKETGKEDGLSSD